MTYSSGTASSDRGPIPIKRIHAVRMTGFQRGYSLDWDGPVPAARPVPTGARGLTRLVLRKYNKEHLYDLIVLVIYALMSQCLNVIYALMSQCLKVA